MDSKFGKGVKTPTFNIESGAELEGWRKFIKRFEISVIGAGLKCKGSDSVKTRMKANDAEAEIFEIEQRKAALLLNSMGEYGMNIFETWNIDIDAMQYTPLTQAFEQHFLNKENIVATRLRFLCLEQKSDERLDRFIERVERSGNICRWGELEEEMNVLIVIKGIHVDKIRIELLLKKELTISKVKQICSRYEPAKVDVVEEESSREYEFGEGGANIDRIGAYSRGSSYRGGSYRGRGCSRGRGRGRGRGCWTCGLYDYDYRECREKTERERKETDRNDGRHKCYVCLKTTHIARNCPDKYKQKEISHGKVKAVAGYYSDSDQESL